MDILLDTNMLIWLVLNKLPKKAEEIIQKRINTIYFSPINILEIVIKSNLNRERRIDFDLDPSIVYASLIDNNYIELKVNSKHSLLTGSLSTYNTDPFDRILLSQAIAENMSFLTSDIKLSKCPYKNIMYIKKP